MVGVGKTVFSRVFELLVFVLSIWPINETPRLFTIAAHLCGWEWRWRKRNWIWIWRGDAHKPSFGCSVLYTFSLSHTFHLCCFSWIWCALENLVLWFFFRATLFALLNKNPKTWVHCVLFKCGNVVTQRKETKTTNIITNFTHIQTHSLKDCWECRVHVIHWLICYRQKEHREALSSKL